MKRTKHIALFVLMILLFSVPAFAEETDYRAGYEKQMKECANTQTTIDGVVQWLKDHNYEKYPRAKDTVEDAFDQAAYGEDAKKKAESFAAKGEWEKAYGWVNQYWQYQVKVATEGLMAKKMVEDAEAAAQQK
jgi:nitrous-oxide reductase